MRLACLLSVRLHQAYEIMSYDRYTALCAQAALTMERLEVNETSHLLLASCFFLFFTSLLASTLPRNRFPAVIFHQVVPERCGPGRWGPAIDKDRAQPGRFLVYKLLLA